MERHHGSESAVRQTSVRCILDRTAKHQSCNLQNRRDPTLARSRDTPETAETLTMDFATTTALLTLTLLGSTASPSGQAVAPTSSPVVPPTQSSSAVPATDLGGYRLPLLREGSVLSRVEGDLTQDPDEKLWLFRPTKSESGGLRREFVLMPSPTLGDMLQTIRVSAVPVEFEMTGRVFIYRGRNFLLPELAPPIVRFDLRSTDSTGAKSSATTSSQPATKVAPSGEAKFVPPAKNSQDLDAAEDAAVDDIEKRLEERIGRAPTRRIPELPGAANTAATRDTSSTGSGDAASGNVRGAQAPVASGERFTLRRGRLLRDPQAGSWRFVPEQFSGNGDGSMEILPCLLLEQLERAARESDAPPVTLMSGTVLAFEGRNFLLPTSFRRAREGRGLGG